MLYCIVLTDHSVTGPVCMLYCIVLTDHSVQGLYVCYIVLY